MNEEECLEMPDGTNTEGETEVMKSEVSEDKDSETISIPERKNDDLGKVKKIGKGIGREIFSWAVKIFIGLGLCAITWKCFWSYGLFTWRTIVSGVITSLYLWICFDIDFI